MRVSVTLGMEFEDIPDFINEHYGKISNKLDSLVKMSDKIALLLESSMYDLCSKEIDKLRLEMASVDMELSEILPIMTGYSEALDKLKNPPAPNPPEQEVPPVEDSEDE